MRASILLLGILTGLAGCATGPSRCYVTLSQGGAPTAEACETGPNLVVRPITESSAAYHVPPYVIGALVYEGFLVPADEGDSAGEAGDEVALAALADSDGFAGPDDPATLRGADLSLALASEGNAEPAAFDGFWDAPVLLQARLGGPLVAEALPPPPDRLDRPPTIDGAVYYRRPRGDYPVFPLATDLIR